MVGQGVGDISLSQCTRKRKRSEIPELSPGSETTATTAASKFFSIVASDDILVEIFVRLPDARTAIQYSSVCKRWYNLTLGGVCNDLLLVFGVRERNYYICNPVTRESLQVPRRPSSEFCFNNGLGLVCQSNSSDNIDTTQCKFKVVFMSGRNDQATIFSSETGRWITSPVSFPGKVHPTYGYYPVSCNGVLYWLDGMEIFNGIAAFDPFKDVDVEGRCRYIDMPVPLGDRWRAIDGSTCFGACQDKLRLSLWLKKRKGCFAVNIWELDGVASWHLVHQLVLKKSDTSKMHVLAFDPKDGDVIFVLCDTQFCRYEIGTKRFQQLGEWPDNTRYRGLKFCVYPLVHPFWPSPIPDLPST